MGIWTAVDSATFDATCFSRCSHGGLLCLFWVEQVEDLEHEN